MTKKMFVAAVVFVAASSIYAQTEQSAVIDEQVEYSKDKYKVETNRFWSNWFIGVGGGAQIYFGDHDKQASFAAGLPRLWICLSANGLRRASECVLCTVVSR